jgi:MSHA pilin protein MshD
MPKFSRFSKQEQGATLVELVMTIVIISVAIAGVVGAFSLIVGRSADPLNQARAVALAQLYYDELVSIYYDNETPLGGGRIGSPGSNFNCNELARSVDVDVPPNYQGFDESQIEISCAGDDTAFQDLDLDDTDVKQITITITDSTGQEYIFSAYRGNF